MLIQLHPRANTLFCMSTGRGETFAGRNEVGSSPHFYSQCQGMFVVSVFRGLSHLPQLVQLFVFLPGAVRSGRCDCDYRTQLCAKSGLKPA